MSTIAEHDADREVLYGALSLDLEEQHDDLTVALELLRLYGYEPKTERSST